MTYVAVNFRIFLFFFLNCVQRNFFFVDFERNIISFPEPIFFKRLHWFRNSTKELSVVVAAFSKICKSKSIDPCLCANHNSSVCVALVFILLLSWSQINRKKRETTKTNRKLKLNNHQSKTKIDLNCVLFESQHKKNKKMKYRKKNTPKITTIGFVNWNHTPKHMQWTNKYESMTGNEESNLVQFISKLIHNWKRRCA